MVATYLFNCRDRKGKVLKGSMTAENKNEVAKRLREEGYLIISIQEKKERKELDLSLFKSKKVKLQDLAIFSRQLATMIEAGLSLVDSLEILVDQTNHPALKEVTASIQEDVEMGKTFHAAVSAHPHVFPSIFRHMIKAGEEGGVMDDILKRLADHIEKDVMISNKVKSAMRYPLMIMVVAIFVVIFLLTTVVPNFVGMFAGFGQELPLPTRLLIGISDWLRSFWWFLFALLGAVFFGTVAYTKKPKGKKHLDALTLRLPLLGALTRKAAISRFTRTMGILTTSGIPIFDALGIVEDVVENQVISEAIVNARQRLGEGVPLSRPLAGSGQFPKMVTQMISIGEETGALDTMLNKVADFYDQEVDTSVDSLIKMIEPVMIILVALVVGFIVISIVLPMFELVTAF